MLSTKMRTTIISAVAALSVLSLGPMTSIASARMPRMKVGKIEVDCRVVDEKGNFLRYMPERSKVTDKDGTVWTCYNGSWWSGPLAREGAISLPYTNPVGPSTLTTLAP
jgi:hypothetical protein